MKFLKKVFQKWLKFARIIGNFQSQILFSLFYLIFLSIVGIVFRSKDPLKIQTSPKRNSQFEPWNHPAETLESARKQF